MSRLRRWIGGKYIGLICKVSPTCLEMARLISAQQDRELPWLTRFRMRLHYGICVGCERYREQLMLLRKVSRRFPETTARHSPERLSTETKKRIERACND